MIHKMAFSARGLFRFEAEKPDGSRRVLAEWFDNNITDFGLDCLGGLSSGYVFNGCAVGSGNTPESNADLTLASFVAGSMTLLSGSDSASAQITTAPYYVAYKGTIRFAAGVAAGNLSEVGIPGNIATDATINGGTTLFSRALIKDGSGTPTVIEVLDDEILDVTYELRIYFPSGGADITGSYDMTIDGSVTSFSYTLRLTEVDQVGTGANLWPNRFRPFVPFRPTTQGFGIGYDGGVTNGDIGIITAGPAGSSTAWSTRSADSYVEGSYTKKFHFPLDLTKGNLSGGIKSMQLGFTVCAYQMQISPVVLKTSAKAFVVDFDVSWGRYAP